MKKWGIIFSGNPIEKPLIRTVNIRRIWEAAKHDYDNRQ